jgi:glyoxylase-like metal-dependent hydrolase (beta-lactamase superfamily II)
MPALRLLPLCLALAACMPEEVRTVRPTPLGDDLVFVRGGGGNSLVLSRGGQALVLDPKLFPYDGAVREALAGTGARVRWVVETHAHNDHTQAAEYWPGTLVIASPLTAHERELAWVGPQLPRSGGVASLPVRGRLAFAVGGERVEVVALPPGHTAGDLALWLPARRVLATGDGYAAGFYPHVDPALGGTWPGLLDELDLLCAFDADVVVPGHGPQTKRAELVAARDWLRTMRDRVAKARKAGDSDAQILDALAPGEGEPYTDLGLYSSRRGVVEGWLAALPRAG